MGLKTTLAALALVALPTLAAAECSWTHPSDTAVSCPSGTTLDAQTGACVKQTTS